MTLHELRQKINDLCDRLGDKDMDVTMVVKIKSEFFPALEVEKPLHEIAVGKDQIHLICPNV